MTVAPTAGEDYRVDAAVTAHLAAMPGVPLERLRNAALLDRIDTKFVLTSAQLHEVLTAIAADYAALDIDGTRSFAYTTTYYDTPERHCFRDHVRGRPVRAKLRDRFYHATGDRWREIKVRLASGRTRKERHPLATDGPGPVDAAPPWTDAWLEAVPRHLEASRLEPVLDVRYARATLLSAASTPERPERVTIDQGLTWMAAGREVAAGPLVVMELKQAHRTESPVRRALRGAGVRPRALSKYCLGVTALEPAIAPATLRTQWIALQRLA